MTVAGRVVDETGAGIEGARVEFRPADGGTAIPASSDPAGNFRANLAAEGDYAIRAERQGFYLYQGKRSFAPGPTQLTVTLNHEQEFSEKVDVAYSPPPIDPQQSSDHKELVNAEIQATPFPASQDYRNALALMNGVVLDNSGIPHFNGGSESQTNYTLDGFNISDPVTGQLQTRLNVDTIQSTARRGHVALRSQWRRAYLAGLGQCFCADQDLRSDLLRALRARRHVQRSQREFHRRHNAFPHGARVEFPDPAAAQQ